MNSQLEYLYIQLLSIVTSERLVKLENNPTVSSMRALSDTEEVFEQIITYTTNTLSSLLNSFQTLIIDNIARNKLYNICDANRVK